MHKPSSSARHAADKITRGLVTRGQGHAASAPVRAETHKGPALHSAFQSKQKRKADVSSHAAAASLAGAAAALEQAVASGQLGCPKCRQAKFGCKRCRSRYVRVTGKPIPVDSTQHTAASALLQHPAVGSQSKHNKGQSAVESSQIAAAKSKVRQDTAVQTESRKRPQPSSSQPAQQQPPTHKRSSSSQPKLQPEAKKQKTSTASVPPKTKAQPLAHCNAKSCVLPRGTPAAASVPVKSRGQSTSGPKAKSSLLPKGTSAAALVSVKTRTQSVSRPKPLTAVKVRTPASGRVTATPKSVARPKALTAVKLNHTASGRVATAAGRAVADVLDSKLGCSKCRFVPSGCKRCRSKQAGQLSMPAAEKA